MHENEPTCDDCEQDLFQLNGEWHCPACNSVSGFELTPREEDFQV
jgi:uncharacterized Zn finger protein (UPF0148 family)